MDNKYMLNKFSHSNTIKVPEATEILYQFGICNSVSDERKTRSLIANGKLKAVKPPNANPRDRRAPYLTSQSALYKCIVDEIPIMEDVFEYFRQQTPVKGKKKVSASKSETKQGESSKQSEQK